MFASRAMNKDPFPYVGEHGSRHAYAGTLNQKPLTFAPRPEYDNEPNPALIAFRELHARTGNPLTSDAFMSLSDAFEDDLMRWSPEEWMHYTAVLLRIVRMRGRA